MLNNKIKTTALLSIALLAAPGFAKNMADNLLGAPQPYLSDVGNVGINFQTVNNFLPTSTSGPSTYTGKPVIHMAISNNSSNPVTVSCTGDIKPRICTSGTNITDCTWTDQTAIETSKLGTYTATGVLSSLSAGASTTSSFTPDTNVTTSDSGWGLEVYNSSVLTCTITDTVNGNIATKIFFIPVA